VVYTARRGGGVVGRFNCIPLSATLLNYEKESFFKPLSKKSIVLYGAGKMQKLKKK